MMFKCENCGSEHEGIKIVASPTKFELGDDYFMQIKKCSNCGGQSKEIKVDEGNYDYVREDSDCAGGACKI
ncbi:hypothetical protein [Vibrio cholerae]|uniref:hypothetical protein n=1 Tax=Vibrio cholerae TaxID=666 RepID=UPI00053C9E8F|nr:hypothetical protein [Vibrio cholerae]